MSRTATIQRKTAETDIRLEVDLDGSGRAEIATGVGFFDHMLALLAKHAALDLVIEAKGDLHVDQHHTVEDVGICLGPAVRQALGDRAGIRRYGHFTLPMDETLATCAVDLGGRPYFVFEARVPQRPRSASSTASWWPTSGRPSPSTSWPTYTSSSTTAATAITLPKASSSRPPAPCAIALESDPRISGVPSTKGVL